MLAFKDVTAPTNVRTMIAAVVSSQAYGNTLPILMPDADGIASYKQCGWLFSGRVSIPFRTTSLLDRKFRDSTSIGLSWSNCPWWPTGIYDRRFGKYHCP